MRRGAVIGGGYKRIHMDGRDGQDNIHDKMLIYIKCKNLRVTDESNFEAIMALHS